MTSILKSDIFFFITTIAVVVISAGLAIALVYIIRILKDVNDLSKKVKEEGDAILDDVHAIHQDIKSRGVHLAGLLSFLGFHPKSTKKVAKKKETGV